MVGTPGELCRSQIKFSQRYVCFILVMTSTNCIIELSDYLSGFACCFWFFLHLHKNHICGKIFKLFVFRKQQCLGIPHLWMILQGCDARSRMPLMGVCLCLSGKVYLCTYWQTCTFRLRYWCMFIFRSNWIFGFALIVAFSLALTGCC